MTHIRRYETTGRPVFITAVLHRRIPYLKILVGQVAPQALPDAYETTKFLFRSDWTLAASAAAHTYLESAASCSRITRFRTLPAMLRGNSSMMITRWTRWNFALTCRLIHCISSSGEI